VTVQECLLELLHGMRVWKTAAIVAVIVSCGLTLLQGDVPSVQTGSWTTAAMPLSARTGAASVLLPDGRVLVTGGSDADNILASVELFGEPSGFAAATSLQISRADHALALLPDGSVLAVGGRTGEGSTATTEIYSNGQWTLAASLTEARWGHTATLLKDGRVLVAGGENEDGPVASVEVYDPATQGFSVAGTLGSPRKGHAAALLQDGRVIIAGGFDGEQPLASIDIYDPSSESITDGGALSVARAGLTATTLLDGRVLMFGGFDGTHELLSAEIFDAATGLSMATGSALSPRRDHDAFLLPANNSVLIVGGVSDGAASASTELYLPWAGSFRSTGSLNLARTHATGAALATRGRLLLTGGESAGGAAASSEIYKFATIETDRDDYAPGEVVTITGGGWQPGETVRLLLQEVTPEHADRLLTAVADEHGNILNNSFAPEEHHLGVRFYLTATGAGAEAQLTFTDSRTINSVTLNGAAAVTVAPGAPITVVINVTTANGGGNQNWRGTSWQVGSSGSGNCFDHPDHEGLGNYTETFVINAPAAPGAYDASFTAFASNACDSQPSEVRTLVKGVTVVVPDAVAPTTNIVLGPSAPNGNNDWYTQNVHVTVSASDNSGGSGVADTRCVLDPAAPPANYDTMPSGCAYLGAGADVMTDGSHTLYAASKDVGGNKESVTSRTFKIDKTAPAVTATPDRGADANGWYNHALTVTYAGTDTASGLDSCVPASVYSGPDSGSTSVSGTCADLAGNTATGSYEFKYDATAPVSVTASADRATDRNGWYNHALTVTWNGTDPTSGIESCDSTPYSGGDSGAASLDGRCTDNAGNSSAPVAFAFKYDSTAPIVAAIPDRPADHNDWYNHALTVTFSASDATAGVDSCDAPVAYSAPDNAAVSVSGNCQDQAGNTASASYGFKYDATAPVNVTAAADRGTDHNGWYNHALTVTWTGTDATSGIAACTQTTYAGPDGAVASVSGNCSDVAGNSSADVAFGFSYDATAPVVVHNPAGDSCSVPGNLGWCRATQTAAFVATDVISGFSTGNSYNLTQSSTTNGVAVLIASGPVSDVAGNTSAGVTAGPYKIDSVAPTIAFNTPSTGSPYLLNQSVSAMFSCTDTLAGFAGGSTVPGPSAGCQGASQVNTSSVGAGKVFAVTATDLAGNESAGSVLYGVQYGVCVLYDETKAVKQNATVPVKVGLCDANGVNQSSPGVVLHAVGITPESGTLTGILDDAGQANPDYDFRYTVLTTGGGYIFNLSTKGIPSGVWRLHFTVSNDPVTHTVKFGVK
jgi:hypothetical protein